MSWHDPQGTLPSRIDAARRLAVAMGYSRETTEQVCVDWRVSASTALLGYMPVGNALP